MADITRFPLARHLRGAPTQHIRHLRQGKLVHFAPTGPGMGGTPVAGCLAQVTITAGHPHHLSGQLGAVTARPRHRIRIPVASA